VEIVMLLVMESQTKYHLYSHERLVSSYFIDTNFRFANIEFDESNNCTFHFRQVILEDSVPVTAVALVLPDLTSNNLQIAVGKASGCVSAFQIQRRPGAFNEACQRNAHSQLVSVLALFLKG
jgi:hypothetical protein